MELLYHNSYLLSTVIEGLINTRTGRDFPMRYKHIREFVEKLERERQDQKQDEVDDTKPQRREVPGVPLVPQVPQVPQIPRLNPTIEQFINNCIPSEVSEEDEQEAREWLRGQLTSVEILGRYNPNRIRLSLRQIGMLDPNENVRLSNYTIDQFLRLKPSENTSMTDASAVSKLMAASKRISQDVIMTVMSGLDDDTLTMNQGLYDTLAYYIGRRFNGKRIETAIDRKFHIDHGAFLIFRNIRDATCYINILIDTDRHLIRCGKRIDSMTILTTGQDKVFNSERLRQNVTEKNDSYSRTLFNTIEPILIELQEMMNRGDAVGVYDYLGIRFEEDIRAKIEKNDPELIKKTATQ